MQQTTDDSAAFVVTAMKLEQLVLFSSEYNAWRHSVSQSHSKNSNVKYGDTSSESDSSENELVMNPHICLKADWLLKTLKELSDPMLSSPSLLSHVQITAVLVALQACLNGMNYKSNDISNADTIIDIFRKSGVVDVLLKRFVCDPRRIVFVQPVIATDVDCEENKNDRNLFAFIAKHFSGVGVIECLLSLRISNTDWKSTCQQMTVVVCGMSLDLFRVMLRTDERVRAYFVAEGGEKHAMRLLMTCPNQLIDRVTSLVLWSLTTTTATQSHRSGNDLSRRTSQTEGIMLSELLSLAVTSLEFALDELSGDARNATRATGVEIVTMVERCHAALSILESVLVGNSDVVIMLVVELAGVESLFKALCTLRDLLNISDMHIPALANEQARVFSSGPLHNDTVHTRNIKLIDEPDNINAPPVCGAVAYLHSTNGLRICARTLSSLVRVLMIVDRTQLYHLPYIKPTTDWDEVTHVAIATGLLDTYFAGDICEDILQASCDGLLASLPLPTVAHPNFAVYDRTVTSNDLGVGLSIGNAQVLPRYTALSCVLRCIRTLRWRDLPTRTECRTDTMSSPYTDHPHDRSNDTSVNSAHFPIRQNNTSTHRSKETMKDRTCKCDMSARQPSLVRPRSAESADDRTIGESKILPLEPASVFFALAQLLDVCLQWGGTTYGVTMNKLTKLIRHDDSSSSNGGRNDTTDASMKTSIDRCEGEIVGVGCGGRVCCFWTEFDEMRSAVEAIDTLSTMLLSITRLTSRATNVNLSTTVRREKTSVVQLNTKYVNMACAMAKDSIRKHLCTLKVLNEEKEDTSTVNVANVREIRVWLDNAATQRLQRYWVTISEVGEREYPQDQIVSTVNDMYECLRDARSRMYTDHVCGFVTLHMRSMANRRIGVSNTADFASEKHAKPCSYVSASSESGEKDVIVVQPAGIMFALRCVSYIHHQVHSDKRRSVCHDIITPNEKSPPTELALLHTSILNDAVVNVLQTILQIAVVSSIKDTTHGRVVSRTIKLTSPVSAPTSAPASATSFSEGSVREQRETPHSNGATLTYNGLLLELLVGFETLLHPSIKCTSPFVKTKEKTHATTSAQTCAYRHVCCVPGRSVDVRVSGWWSVGLGPLYASSVFLALVRTLGYRNIAPEELSILQKAIVLGNPNTFFHEKRLNTQPMSPGHTPVAGPTCTNRENIEAFGTHTQSPTTARNKPDMLKDELGVNMHNMGTQDAWMMNRIQVIDTISDVVASQTGRPAHCVEFRSNHVLPVQPSQTHTRTYLDTNERTYTNSDVSMKGVVSEKWVGGRVGLTRTRLAVGRDLMGFGSECMHECWDDRESSWLKFEGNMLMKGTLAQISSGYVRNMATCMSRSLTSTETTCTAESDTKLSESNRGPASVAEFTLSDEVGQWPPRDGFAMMMWVQIPTQTCTGRTNGHALLPPDTPVAHRMDHVDESSVTLIAVNELTLGVHGEYLWVKTDTTASNKQGSDAGTSLRGSDEDEMQSHWNFKGYVSLLDGAWHHVVVNGTRVSADKGRVSVFIDGVRAGTYAPTPLRTPTYMHTDNTCKDMSDSPLKTETLSNFEETDQARTQPETQKSSSQLHSQPEATQNREESPKSAMYAYVPYYASSTNGPSSSVCVKINPGLCEVTWCVGTITLLAKPLNSPAQPLLMYMLGSDWDGRIPRHPKARWTNNVVNVNTIIHAKTELDDLAPILLQWSENDRWDLLKSIGQSILCQYSPRKNLVTQNVRFDHAGNMIVNVSPAEVTAGMTKPSKTIESLLLTYNRDRSACQYGSDGNKLVLMGTGIERHHVRIDANTEQTSDAGMEKKTYPFVDSDTSLPTLGVMAWEPAISGTVYVHHRNNIRDSMQAIGGVEVILFHLIRLSEPISTSSGLNSMPQRMTSEVNSGVLPASTTSHISSRASSDCSQTALLQLLFLVTSAHVANSVAIRSCKGYSLLRRFLRSKRCKPTVGMLTVVVDACVSVEREIHKYAEARIDDDSSMKVASRIVIGRAVISNKELVDKILLDTQIWASPTRPELHHTYVTVLSDLLHVSHPEMRLFNCTALRDVGGVDRVLQLLKEMSPMPLVIVREWVRCLASLLKARPDVHEILKIKAFLFTALDENPSRSTDAQEAPPQQQRPSAARPHKLRGNNTENQYLKPQSAHSGVTSGLREANSIPMMSTSSHQHTGMRSSTQPVHTRAQSSTHGLLLDQQSAMSPIFLTKTNREERAEKSKSQSENDNRPHPSIRTMNRSIHSGPLVHTSEFVLELLLHILTVSPASFLNELVQTRTLAPFDLFPFIAKARSESSLLCLLRVLKTLIGSPKAANAFRTNDGYRQLARQLSKTCLEQYEPCLSRSVNTSRNQSRSRNTPDVCQSGDTGDGRSAEDYRKCNTSDESEIKENFTAKQRQRNNQTNIPDDKEEKSPLHEHPGNALADTCITPAILRELWDFNEGEESISSPLSASTMANAMAVIVGQTSPFIGLRRHQPVATSDMPQHSQGIQGRVSPIRLRRNSYALVPSVQKKHLMDDSSSDTVNLDPPPETDMHKGHIHVGVVTMAYLLPVVRGSPCLLSEILFYINEAINQSASALSDLINAGIVSVLCENIWVKISDAEVAEETLQYSQTEGYAYEDCMQMAEQTIETLRLMAIATLRHGLYSSYDSVVSELGRRELICREHNMIEQAQNLVLARQSVVLEALVYYKKSMRQYTTWDDGLLNVVGSAFEVTVWISDTKPLNTPSSVPTIKKDGLSRKDEAQVRYKRICQNVHFVFSEAVDAALTLTCVPSAPKRLKLVVNNKISQMIASQLSPMSDVATREYALVVISESITGRLQEVLQSNGEVNSCILYHVQDFLSTHTKLHQCLLSTNDDTEQSLREHDSTRCSTNEEGAIAPNAYGSSNTHAHGQTHDNFSPTTTTSCRLCKLGTDVLFEFLRSNCILPEGVIDYTRSVGMENVRPPTRTGTGKLSRFFTGFFSGQAEKPKDARADEGVGSREKPKFGATHPFALILSNKALECLYDWRMELQKECLQWCDRLREFTFQHIQSGIESGAQFEKEMSLVDRQIHDARAAQESFSRALMKKGVVENAVVMKEWAKLTDRVSSALKTWHPESINLPQMWQLDLTEGILSRKRCRLQAIELPLGSRRVAVPEHQIVEDIQEARLSIGKNCTETDGETEEQKTPISPLLSTRCSSLPMTPCQGTSMTSTSTFNRTQSIPLPDELEYPLSTPCSHIHSPISSDLQSKEIRNQSGQEKNLNTFSSTSENIAIPDQLRCLLRECNREIAQTMGGFDIINTCKFTMPKPKCKSKMEQQVLSISRSLNPRSNIDTNVAPVATQSPRGGLDLSTLSPSDLAHLYASIIAEMSDETLSTILKTTEHGSMIRRRSSLLTGLCIPVRHGKSRLGRSRTNTETDSSTLNDELRKMVLCDSHSGYGVLSSTGSVPDMSTSEPSASSLSHSHCIRTHSLSEIVPTEHTNVHVPSATLREDVAIQKGIDNTSNGGSNLDSKPSDATNEASPTHTYQMRMRASADDCLKMRSMRKSYSTSSTHTQDTRNTMRSSNVRRSLTLNATGVFGVGSESRYGGGECTESVLLRLATEKKRQLLQWYEEDIRHLAQEDAEGTPMQRAALSEPAASTALFAVYEGDKAYGSQQVDGRECVSPVIPFPSHRHNPDPCTLMNSEASPIQSQHTFKHEPNTPTISTVKPHLRSPPPTSTAKLNQNLNLHSDSQELFTEHFPGESENPPIEPWTLGLLTDETILYVCDCAQVTVSTTTSGQVVLGSRNVYYCINDQATQNLPESLSEDGTANNSTDFTKSNSPRSGGTWPLSDIRYVFRRRYLMQEIGLEIFLTTGKTYLLVFFSPHDREQLRTLLLKQNLAHLIASEPEKILKSVTNAWSSGYVSNYDYLMQVNTLAGRSFNDLSQYPVMPWVLSDYTSDTLDLSNPHVYRDLSKPMGALTTHRLNRFVEKFRTMVELGSEGGLGAESGADPYYYGSHYSNLGAVLHFLVRVRPYTERFVAFQGGRFDLPDRTFHSIEHSWRLASSLSSTDVKELIPEFFYLPEFLVNHNRYDFGVKQDGIKVGDVELPPWAKGDARFFIMKHREALESPWVTEHLHQWIDLIFGVKQTGKQAVAAYNVFHPMTYNGAVDVNSIIDPVQRNAVLTQIRSYGQTPQKLFLKAHIQKSASTLPSTKVDGKSILCLSIPCSLPASPAPPKVLIAVNAWNLENGKGPSDSGIAHVSGDAVASTSLVSRRSYPRAKSREFFSPVGRLYFANESTCVAVTCKSTVLLPPEFNHAVTWDSTNGPTLVAYSPDRYACVTEVLSDDNFISCAAASNVDRQGLFTGSEQGQVSIWRIRRMREKFRAEFSEWMYFDLISVHSGHRGRVNCLSACDTFRFFVTGGEDGRVCVWDIDRCNLSLELKPNDGAVTHLATHLNTGAIITISRELGDHNVDPSMRSYSVLNLFTINGELVSTRIYTYCEFPLTDVTSRTHVDWERERIGARKGQESARDLSVEIVSLCITQTRNTIGADIVIVGDSAGVVCAYSLVDLTPVYRFTASVRGCPITNIETSPSGASLITSDQSGRVVWWKNRHAISDRHTPKLVVMPGLI
eukprot:CFRG5149T1